MKYSVIRYAREKKGGKYLETLELGNRHSSVGVLLRYRIGLEANGLRVVDRDEDEHSAHKLCERETTSERRRSTDE